MAPSIAYFIQAVNIVILIMIAKTTFYCFRKCYKKESKDLDYTFYQIMFLMAVSLMIANSMAFYTAHVIYFKKSVYMPEDISLGRYVDRFAMLIAYVGFDLLSLKYLPSWFKK